MSDTFTIEFSDPYDIHRVIMRQRHGYCGPYRLGVSVGECGEDLPPPPHYITKSVKTYLDGVEAGKRKRAHQPEGE